MLFDKNSFSALKDRLADSYEKAAEVLRNLPIEPIIIIETHNNSIIGEIMGLKEEDLLIKVLAARVFDYKIRNLTSITHKKRTYPIQLWMIVSSNTIEESQIPLYINYKYLSPQFKNRYLR